MNNMNKEQTLINRVETAIQCAESKTTKLTEAQLNPKLLPGMSGKKSRILLNELIKSDTRYLEVGTYVGSTFISALYDNHPESAQAIDFFIEHGQGFRDDFWRNIEAHRSHLPDFTFYDENCWALKHQTKSAISEINTYFFDGPHEEQDQCWALTQYKDAMDDVFIFIVDDWNWQKVKDGTYRGIRESNLEILKSWELISGGGDHENYWNSWFVAVLKK